MTGDLKTFLKTYIAIGAVISLLAIYQTQMQTEALFKIHTRYKWVILMAFFALYAVAGFYTLVRSEWLRWPWRLTFPAPTAPGWRLVGILLVIIPFPLVWLAKADFYGRGLEAFFRLIWLFWFLALLQTVGLKLSTRLSWQTSLAFALLLDGMVAQVYQILTPVSDYPFSAGWSEASRFYYASLAFSKSIYGVQVPLSVWHGTRYFLQSIPFLVQGMPIWVHRLWQAILWLGITGLTSWLLVRRLELQEPTTALILAAWFFLYVFQGAVYYHLQVCVLIVLLGVHPRRPWWSLLAIMAASFWAGMSRLNWFPVPAMLGIAICLLEEPLSSGQGIWRYIARPALWGVVGLGSALLGQAFYIAVSGNTNLEAFGSSLTSALLWYRWFPSDTNPIGIIPGVLIVSAPLFVLIGFMVRGHVRNLHPLRWVGLLGMLLVLLGGGLVVSTKIGGGGDLHNMDAYLVLLGMIGAYFLAGRVRSEQGAVSGFAAPLWPGMALLLIVPVAFSLVKVGTPFDYDHARAAGELAQLRQAVQAYSKSGPVLFMYERQLLTFGTIPDVRLVPEYEVVSMMEMAISGNRIYMSKYYKDLETHRFAAIVAHRQNLGVETGDFIEESNVWNQYVAQPLLCQYKPVLTLSYMNTQVFVPRQKPCAIFPPVVEGP